MTRDRGHIETVGWREYVAFPDFHVPRLLAKIDTGARISAIHAEEIERVGSQMVRFRLVMDRKTEKSKWVKARLVRMTKIKPSSGRAQLRYVIEAKIRLGSHQFKTEISLVSRSEMLCRMLVGRETLRGRYLVDADRTFVVSRSKKKKKKESAAE